MTAGDRLGASLPSRTLSASWKSPAEIPRRYRIGSKASKLVVRRAQRGSSAELNRIRSAAGPGSRSRTLTRWTSTGPIPVWIRRSGPWPWRTKRSRPSASFRSFFDARKASTSASMACSSNWRAPDRRRAVSGSSISLGRRSWTMLVSSFMAYRSLVEVQAGVKHLPRYAAFLTSSSPSFRHSSKPVAQSHSGRQIP